MEGFIKVKMEEFSGEKMKGFSRVKVQGFSRVKMNGFSRVKITEYKYKNAVVAWFFQSCSASLKKHNLSLSDP